MNVTGCVVDSDCLPSGPAAWCFTGAVCQTNISTCILFPRCRSVPYLGCAPVEQQCVHWRVEPGVLPGTESRLTPTEQAGFIVILILCTLALTFNAIWIFFRYWRKQVPRDESLEPTSSSSSLRHQEHPSWSQIMPRTITLGAPLTFNASTDTSLLNMQQTHIDTQLQEYVQFITHENKLLGKSMDESVF